MTFQRVRLERFDATEGAAPSMGAVEIAVMSQAAETDPAPEPAPPEPEAVAPPAATDVEPDAPDPSLLAAAIGSVEALASHARARLDMRIQELSESFARAAATAVPHLARTAFPAEIAAASLAILRRARAGPEPLTLRLSPGDATRVAAILTARKPSEVELGPGLEVVADAALPPGEARLDWTEGGASFDAAALAGAAAACLDTALDPNPAPEADR